MITTKQLTKVSIMVVLSTLIYLTQPALSQEGATTSLTKAYEILIDSILTEVSWSPDGTQIMVSGGNGVQIFTSKLEPIAQYQFGENSFILTSQWSPTDNLAASISVDEVFYLWNPTTGKILDSWETKTSVYANLTWSSDGSKIAFGDLDNKIILYDAAKRDFTSIDLTIADIGYTTLISWHPDNKRIGFSSVFDSPVYIWDTGENQQVARIRGSEKLVVFSPDGEKMAITGFTGNDLDFPPIPVIYIWNIDAVKPSSVMFIQQFDWDTNRGFYAVKWHPNSIYLATSNFDQTIRIWNTELNVLAAEILTTPKTTIDYPLYNSIAWSPDGKQLADVGTDGTIRIWNFDVEK